MHNADERLERDLVNALDALDALDYPVPPASVDDVIQRAHARAAQRRWRFAAAAVVMLAASAAAALPGSPVRRWVESVLRGVSSAEAPRSRSPAREPAVEPTVVDMRGVVTFIGDSAEVVFTAWQDSGDVVIRFIQSAELRIRSAASPAGYQVRPSGILINNVGSGATYELDVSDAAENVRVLANGRVIFERRQRRVTVGPSPRADGAHVVSLRPTERQ